MNLEDPMKEISEKLDFIAIQENRRNLLLDMPEGPMREILGECDFIEVETLRKTCHSLRNFIDDQHIDPKFSALYFMFAEDVIELTLYSETSEDATELTYKEHGNHTKMFFEKYGKSYRKLVENIGYIDLFCQDFKLLTKNSKSIPSMSFIFLIDWFPEKVSKEFLKILKIQNFRTEKLFFNVNGPNQIYSILQCFNSNFLKSMCISDSKKSDRTLHLEEVVKLEQWNNLAKVEIQCSTVKKPERFRHLKKGTANFMTITRGDLEVLKESFLHSPNFSHMVLKYINLDDPPQIFQFLGDHCWIDDGGFGWNRRRWFYRIPNPQDDVLSVEINSREVIFKSQRWDEVPVGAIVKE